MTRSRAYDVAVVGASLGGVSAALAAASNGASVVLVGTGGWIGGQLTSQGVCTPDENLYIESGGASATYLALRAEMRAHYAERYRLSPRALSTPHLNIGDCWVSRLACEPRVAEAILRARVGSAGNLAVLDHTRVLSVRQDHDTIRGITLSTAGGEPFEIVAAMFLDATDQGDLIELAGVEHTVGAESRDETGEPDAPDDAHPDWIQPFTVPFALELRPRGEDHTIARPPHYEAMRDLQRYHIVDGSMSGMFGPMGWWEYRRVISAASFDDPAFPCDVAMVNTGSNDYMGGPGIGIQADANLEAGRLASLGYVYWLQTECPRHDDPTRNGYPELRLRADWFGTADGLAPEPYIRESRRIRALACVTEMDIVRRSATGVAGTPGPRAPYRDDTCAIGHYWLDIHKGHSPEPGLFLETWPYQVPMGALVPIRVTNLLAACKNLGVTHLTNGAFRLHPIEWAIGEAAGHLAAWSLANGILPRETWSARRRRFQAHLVGNGMPLAWWPDLAPSSPYFAAAQQTIVNGTWPQEEQLEFRPEALIGEATRKEVEARSGGRLRLEGMTRGEAVVAAQQAASEPS